MNVTGPDLIEYRISRRWLPWRRKVRSDVFEGSGGASDSGLWVIDDDPISLILGVLLLFPIVLIAALFALEILVLLLLAPLAVLVRALLGVPWEIEVLTRRHAFSAQLVHAEPVSGWRASGEKIRVLAAAAEAGTLPSQRRGGPRTS